MKRWIEKQHEYENEEVIFDRRLYNKIQERFIYNPIYSQTKM